MGDHMVVPEGKYAFRFDGFAMGNSILHRLVGVGFMTLKGKLVTGEHRSTLCQLEGQAPALKYTAYELDGTYADAGDFGEATISFMARSPAALDMKGKFVFVPAGQDRYWLISQYGELTGPRGVEATEVVSGEAVRLN